MKMKKEDGREAMMLGLVNGLNRRVWCPGD
jgi:hypothetical protein